MAGEQPKIDPIDLRILSALRADGRMSARALGDIVGLSAGAAQARVRRLERDGVISGYHASVDAIRAGWSVTAFAEVRLSDRNPAAFVQLENALGKLPWVVEAHRTVGDYDVLLHLRAPDMASLTEGLGRALSDLPVQVSTRVSVATQTLQSTRDQDWPIHPK